LGGYHISEVVGVGEILIDFVSTKPASYVEASTFQRSIGVDFKV